MKRIIFVGVHNKPGYNPLDSRTKSGKLIDCICTNLTVMPSQIVKTNLFDAFEIPTDPEIIKGHIDRWWFDNLFSPKGYDGVGNEIIVTLGLVVAKHLKAYGFNTFIALMHPSAIWSSQRKRHYIDNAVQLIHQKIYSL